MVIYNISNLTASNDYLTILQVTNNEISGGFLGIGLIFAFFIIFMMTFLSKGLPLKSSFAGASWVTMLISILFTLMELIDIQILVVTIFMVLGSVVMFYLE